MQVYFSVGDIKEACARVKSLGGEVRSITSDLPGFGRFATCVDDQGMEFHLHQAPARDATVRPPEWLIATQPGDTTDDVTEWLIHTLRPRFVCRAVDQTAGDSAGSSSLGCVESDVVLQDFLWIDPKPAEPEVLAKLLAAAMVQLRL